MKKLLTLMIIGIFLLTLFASSVSAFEFDNVKSYDQATKTVTIKNSILGIPFLDLDTVATAKLITPQVNYVLPGKDVKVMIFEVENYGDLYTDALKDLEFINIKKEFLNSMMIINFEYPYGNFF